jgi:hypothetical protein
MDRLKRPKLGRNFLYKKLFGGKLRP